MKEFIVRVKNKPGGLERVAYALHKHGVNIESLASEVTKDHGIIKMITNDIVSTEKSLEESDMDFTTNDVLVVKMLNRPGELAKLASMLSSARINILSIYLLGEGKFAIRVDQNEKAKSVLRGYLI